MVRGSVCVVQDLDSARINHTLKSHDYKAFVSKPSTSPLPNRSSTQTSSHRYDIKDKSLERDNKNKGPKFPKVSPQLSVTNAKVMDT